MTLRVLVIDDDTAYVPSLVRFLNDSGHQARHVTSWIEVFPAVRSFEPDVALVDLALTGIRGEDVAAGLKRFSPVHVLLHSAASQDELDRALVRSQADGIARKGRPRDLLSRLNELEGELAIRRSARVDSGKSGRVFAALIDRPKAG